MREILFRGKRKDNGEWIKGYYLCIGGKYHYILTGILDITKGFPDLVKYEVIPETIGQYIGLTDKNGKEIFEGYILKVCRGEDIEIGYVIYDERMAAYSVSVTENDCLVFIDWFIAKQEDNRVWIEVIGNIHDNPELLKEGAE